MHQNIKMCTRMHTQISLCLKSKIECQKRLKRKIYMVGEIHTFEVAVEVEVMEVLLTIY